MSFLLFLGSIDLDIASESLRQSDLGLDLLGCANAIANLYQLKFNYVCLFINQVTVP
jgi:hypothetical protein